MGNPTIVNPCVIGNFVAISNDLVKGRWIFGDVGCLHVKGDNDRRLAYGSELSVEVSEYLQGCVGVVALKG
ncbi:MAG: hypothetical protein WBC73_11695 [Phormidesmis sp.]